MYLTYDALTYVWVPAGLKGALYRNETQLATTGIPNIATTSQHTTTVYMDASRSSSYYGASSKPQVDALQSLMIIKD